MIWTTIAKEHDRIDSARTDQIVDEMRPVVRGEFEVNRTGKIVEPRIAAIQVNLCHLTAVGEQETRKLTKKRTNRPLKEKYAAAIAKPLEYD